LQQLDIARKEYELGISREIDLVGVELSVSNQEMDLETATNDLEQAVYAMKKTLGLSPDREIALEGSIDSHYQGLTIDRPASWFVTIATANNLDLQTAAFKVTQTEAQVAIARSQYLPQVDASVSFSLSGPGLPLQTPAVSLGLDVSFPQSVAPVKTSATGGVTGSSSTTRSLSVTADPLQSVTGYLDDVDALLQLEDARVALKRQTRDLSFQIGQLLSAYKRQNTAIRIGRRSLDLEEKKLRVLAQQVADGSATRVDLLEEETTAANLEVSVLSDVLSLIGTERTLEKLMGIEPGGLARLVGGANEGS
ncbi:MAG TPA: TolC family protein, partial [Spirochaetia bacterium]